LTKQGTGKARQLFSQAPKPSFAAIAYDSPPQRCLFALRRTLPDAPFAPWPYTRTVQLVEALRDAVAERLKPALPQRDALIERVLIGRGATEADKAARVRIVPLPSVGTPNTDPSIRRVLVEIPPNCPVPALAPLSARKSKVGPPMRFFERCARPALR
jgi:CRISPR-associated protein Csb2